MAKTFGPPYHIVRTARPLTWRFLDSGLPGLVKINLDPSSEADEVELTFGTARGADALSDMDFLRAEVERVAKVPVLGIKSTGPFGI